MTYWFEDMASGEEFFVEEITRENAFKIAYQNFKEPHFIDTVTNEEAEMMGLDTYQKGEIKMRVEKVQEYNVMFDNDEMKTLLSCVNVLVDCKETMKELKCTNLYTSSVSLGTNISYEELLNTIEVMDSLINDIDKMA